MTEQHIKARNASPFANRNFACPAAVASSDPIRSGSLLRCKQCLLAASLRRLRYLSSFFAFPDAQAGLIAGHAGLGALGHGTEQKFACILLAHLQRVPFRKWESQFLSKLKRSRRDRKVGRKDGSTCQHITSETRSLLLGPSLPSPTPISR